MKLPFGDTTISWSRYATCMGSDIWHHLLPEMTDRLKTLRADVAHDDDKSRPQDFKASVGCAGAFQYECAERAILDSLRNRLFKVRGEPKPISEVKRLGGDDKGLHLRACRTCLEGHLLVKAEADAAQLQSKDQAVLVAYRALAAARKDLSNCQKDLSNCQKAESNRHSQQHARESAAKNAQLNAGRLCVVVGLLVLDCAFIHIPWHDWRKILFVVSFCFHIIF